MYWKPEGSDLKSKHYRMAMMINPLAQFRRRGCSNYLELSKKSPLSQDIKAALHICVFLQFVFYVKVLRNVTSGLIRYRVVHSDPLCFYFVAACDVWTRVMQNNTLRTF